MCLLYGDDSRRRLQQQQSEDDTRQTTANVYDNDWNNSTIAIPTNSRGLEKNEALAVRYLTRLCGVEPWRANYKCPPERRDRAIYDSDSRRGGPTRIGIMLPHRYWCISIISANSNGLIDIDVEAAAINGHVTSAVFGEGEEDGVGGLQRLVEVARRVVPRVRVYRELGCYLY